MKRSSPSFTAWSSRKRTPVGDHPIKINTVMVDEGQDFSDDMLKVVTAVLNEKTNNLTIALDENQDLYHRVQAWKELGVKVQGRVHRIYCCYRNTREICQFASRLIGKTDDFGEEDGERQIALFQDSYAYNGQRPEIRQFQDVEDVAVFVADTIRKLVDSGECPFSETAIIYTVRSPANSPDKHIPRMFEKALEARGNSYDWVSQDYRSKRGYDVTTNSVTISTVHSARGFRLLAGLPGGTGPPRPARSRRKNRPGAWPMWEQRGRGTSYSFPYVHKTDLIAHLPGVFLKNLDIGF